MSALAQLDRDSRANFDALVEVLRKQPVIGLAGSGLSVPLGYPTWDELLAALLNRLQSASGVDQRGARMLLDDGRIDAAALADWTRTELGEAVYAALLSEIFQPRADRDVSREYLDLARLPVRLWLTTNFDDCLRRALEECRGRAINVASSVPVAHLHESEPIDAVVHLHGHVSEPSGMVLSTRDYGQRYHRDPRLRSAFLGLGAFPVLFLGYGVQDRHLNFCLEETRELFEGSTAPRFSFQPEFADGARTARDAYRHFLNQMGVSAIFYSVRDGIHAHRHDLIRELLIRLELKPCAPDPPAVLQTLYWRAVDADMAAFRLELRALLEIGGQRVPTVLRSLSWRQRAMVLLVKQGGPELERQLDASFFWSRAAAPTDTLNEALAGLPPFLRSPSPEHERTKRGPRAQNELDNVADARQLVELDAGGRLPADDQGYRHLLPVLFHATPALGLADLFHPIVTWVIEGPLVTVFAYFEQAVPDGPKTVRAITVIGKGPRDVQREIEAAAFGVAALLPFDQQLFVNAGFINLAVQDLDDEQQARGLWGKVVQWIARTPASGPTRVPENAQEALASFYSLCSRLAAEKGFVRVHERSVDDLVTYQAQLTLALRGQHRPTILAPTAERGIVCCQSYPRLLGSRDTEKLAIELQGRQLMTGAFDRFMSKYYDSVIARMLADVERRVEFWTQEIEGDTAQVAWFRGLSEEDRLKHPPVTLNKTIDDDLAIELPTEESQTSATDYYLRQLPNHAIPHKRNQLATWKERLKPLEALRKTRFSALWRSCFSRLLDAATRDVELCADDNLNQEFRLWKDQVKGLLRLTWLHQVDEAGISPRDVFKTTTVFSAAYDTETSKVTITANAVIDSGRSVVLVDRRKGMLQVYDPLDEALVEGFVLDTSDSQIETLKVHEGTHAATKISGLSTSADEEVDTLRRHGYESPGLIAALVDDILRPPGENAAFFRAVRDRVVRRVDAATVGSVGIRLLANGCFNSAIELGSGLEEPTTHEEMRVTQLVFECFIDLLLAQQDPLAAMRALRDGKAVSVAPDVRQKFAHALRKDAKVVHEFIEYGYLTPETIAKSPIEEVAWELQRILETGEIAGGFSKAMRSLDPFGERTGTAFFKTEAAFEKVLLARTVRPPLVRRVQKVLTGEPLLAGELS